MPGKSSKKASVADRPQVRHESTLKGSRALLRSGGGVYILPGVGVDPAPASSSEFYIEGKYS